MQLNDTIPVGEAASRYLMQVGANVETQTELNRFVRWVGGSRRLSQLSSHEVAGYAEQLGTTTTDIMRKLDPVKQFLAHAKKEGMTAINLGVNLRPKKGAPRSSGPVRTVSAEQSQMTEEGYKALVEELDALKALRPGIAAELKAAMADKDFRENAPLDAARDRQGQTEARIRELEGLVKHAQVVRQDQTDAVRAALGCTVTIADQTNGGEMQFMLVHPHEANPGQGKMSIASPTGKAVLGRAPGDEVSVTAPAGVMKYKIQAVEPG